MECIPAIDIRGGQAVRLVRGDFSTETVFGEPVEMAERFAAAGAPRVHVVDLDAARTGELVNEKLVGQIVEAVRVPIQYGGGVRDLATLDRVVAAGVSRASSSGPPRSNVRTSRWKPPRATPSESSSVSTTAACRDPQASRGDSRSTDGPRRILCVSTR